MLLAAFAGPDVHWPLPNPAADGESRPACDAAPNGPNGAFIPVRRCRYIARMKRLLLVLFLALPIVLPTPAVGAMGEAGGMTDMGGMPAPGPCPGYPQPRAYLVANDWWMTTQDKAGNDEGHVHVEGCMPVNQRLSGQVKLDVKVVMFNNPGDILRVSGHIFFAGGQFKMLGNTQYAMECPGHHAMCTAVVPLTLNMDLLPVSGWQQLRVKATGKSLTDASGKPVDRFAVVRFPVFVSNGNMRNDNRRRFFEGSGWYGGAEYAVARYTSHSLPGTVSGVWTTPLVWTMKQGRGIPITHSLVTIDPNFHMDDPGTVLYDAPGMVKRSFKIDTTKLAPGTHRLFIRADADDVRGSTHSGALVIPFTVVP